MGLLTLIITCPTSEGFGQGFGRNFFLASPLLMVHGSGANPSADRRIGFAIRYIPTRIRQTGGPCDSATLMWGEDAFGHFEPEPRPEADLDPAMLALHAEISDRQAKILYRGTSKTSF